MASRIFRLVRHFSNDLPSTILSKAITFNCLGSVSKVLEVKTYEIEPLAGEEVLLKILAAPVNPADVNIIEGAYPVKPRFLAGIGAIGGNEGVAEVIKTGENVTRFREGDWVISAGQSNSYGTWQTFAKAQERSLVKLPDCKGISPILVIFG